MSRLGQESPGRSRRNLGIFLGENVSATSIADEGAAVHVCSTGRRSRRSSGWASPAALLIASLALIQACTASEAGKPRPEMPAASSSPAAAPPPTFAAPPELEPARSPTPPRDGDRGYLGVVVALEEVDVASQITGRLERVMVRPGDPVHSGDLLAVLDTSPLRQDLAMAEASLRASRAEVSRTRSQLREAETRYARRAALPDTFSREEVATAELEKETAQAAFEAAEARAAEQEVRIEQLQDSIRRAEIRAPFDGTVSLRYLDPGSTVLSGAPVLRLINTEEMLVRFAVPPEEVGKLSLNQPVEVDIEEAALEARGTVQRIAPEIDGPSRMVFVEARLENPDSLADRLRPGQVARVHPLVG